MHCIMVYVALAIFSLTHGLLTVAGEGLHALISDLINGLYHGTAAVTQDLSFSNLIQRWRETQ
jgi:hypothetical protein